MPLQHFATTISRSVSMRSASENAPVEQDPIQQVYQQRALQPTRCPNRARWLLVPLRNIAVNGLA
jgi:hypothetical protein